MHLFLCDSVRVRFKPAGSATTPEIKIRLWRLYTSTSIHPSTHNCVDLAWNVCQLTKSLADSTSYNHASVKPRWIENWTIHLEVLDLLFTNMVHSKSWISTSVLPSIVAATTTLQIFSLASFWNLPTNLHNNMFCFVKYTSSSDFMVEKQIVDQTLMHSPHRLFIQTWFSSRLSSSFNNLHKYGGNLAFPP